MGRKRQTSPHPLASRRPARESVSEIAALAVAVLGILGAAALFPYNNEAALRLLEWAASAGKVTLEHIGWGFGVVIPTMLGFYAIVTGGQLLGSPSEPRTRRLLGVAAELLFVALVPALLLIVAACVLHPTQAGALFVVVPAYFLMLFLAVQLGGFVVFEIETRLAAFAATREWARNRLRALSRRSRKPAVLVVIVNATVGAVFGTIASLVATGPTDVLVVWALLNTIVAVILALSAFAAFWLTLAARDKSTMVLSWIPVAFLYGGVVVLMVLLWIVPETRSGLVGLLVIVVFVTLSTVWPRSRGMRVLLDWSIQGAAARSAVRTTARLLVKSVAEIAALKPPAEQAPTVLARLRRMIKPSASV